MTESVGVRLLRRPILPATARRQLEGLPAGLRRLAASTGWLAAEHAARMVVGLLVGVYVARYLGPEAFGVLNYAISFVLLFSALSQLGLDNLVVRDLVVAPERAAETLSAAFTLRLAGGTVALGLITVVAWSTQADPIARLTILIIACGLVFQSLEVTAYWFYARTFTLPVAVARLVALAVISTLRIALILLDKPLLWFALPVMLDTAVGAVLMFVFYLREGTAPAIRQRPRLMRLRSMLAEAWPLSLAIAVNEFFQRIDQIMLGELRGSIEVGWYAAAARLSQMSYVVPTLLAMIAFPTILRAKRTSPELYARRLQGFYDVMFWVAIAIAVLASSGAAPLIHLLYGSAYAPSVAVLQIHIWTLVFSSVGMATARWLVAENLSRVVFLYSLGGVIVNVILNLILIPAYGAAGAAGATLLTFLVVMLTQSINSRTRPAATLIAKASIAPWHWRAQRGRI